MKRICNLGAVVCLSMAVSICCRECVAQDTKSDASEKTMKYIDSLRQKLSTAGFKERFPIELILFGNYLQIDTSKARMYLRSCIASAQESGDSLWISQAGLAEGHFLYSYGLIDKSLPILERALGIARRNNFRQQVKYILNNLALAHTEKDRYDKALHYNFESLREREKDGDSLEISIALNNIGYTFSQLDDHERALEYFEKSFDIKIRNNIQWDRSTLLSSIGGELVELGRFEDAEEKYRLALKECDRGRCPERAMVAIYSSLGVSLARQKKPSKAMFEKSLQLGLAGSYTKPIMRNYYWLALLEFEANNLDGALNLLRQASGKGRNSDGLRINSNILKLYALIYAKKGDYETAFGFQRQCLALDQEILNGSLIRRLASIQAEFQERQNLEKLAGQEKVLDLQRASIDRQKMLNVLMGIVALLAVVLVLLLYRSVRQKRRINHLFDRRIRERTSELRTNRDQLQHAHDEQVMIISKLSSELNSAVATLRGLTSTAERDLPERQAIYFRQAGMVADKLATYASSYSNQTDTKTR
jgi:tetratricopeptide (TPR) repeat protein